MSGVWSSLLAVGLFSTALFMIVLVLIQRGKGGGLAGAFGGMGGQSAFGTKAGDLFTRVTIGVAIVWIILCVVAVGVLTDASDNPIDETIGRDDKPAQSVSERPSGEKQADGGATSESTAPKGTGDSEPGS